MPVRLDLNNQVFRSQDDRHAVLQSASNSPLWIGRNLYRDKGFRLELIHSRRAPDGTKRYSIRITKKMGAVARRSGEFLELLIMHPNHDSAYG